MEVLFREADQRAGRFHFEVLTTEDGMRSEYRRTQLATDTMVKRIFRGESSLMAAQRAFNEDVIKEVHGNGIGA